VRAQRPACDSCPVALADTLTRDRRFLNAALRWSSKRGRPAGRPAQRRRRTWTAGVSPSCVCKTRADSGLQLRHRSAVGREQVSSKGS